MAKESCARCKKTHGPEQMIVIGYGPKVPGEFSVRIYVCTDCYNKSGTDKP